MKKKMKKKRGKLQFFMKDCNFPPVFFIFFSFFFIIFLSFFFILFASSGGIDAK